MSPRARRFFGCLVPMVLVLASAATCAMTAYASQIFLVVVDIEDETMTPILPLGRTLIVDNTEFWAQTPFRGQIVYLEADGERMFRRIVGLPGDTVEVRDGLLYVNGTRIAETTIRGTGPDYGPETVAENEFFVLADDRDAADSRTFGVISRRQLFGMASVYSQPAGGFDNVVHADYGAQLETEVPAGATGTP